jgi:serine/threonine protein kinase
MALSPRDGYLLIKMLGRGTYGSVYLAKRRDDSSLLAIKVIGDVERASKMETRVLHSIHHPFIVSYYSSFIAKQKLHICMEYLSGGNLYTRMLSQRRIPLKEAKLYVAEIALALSELHSHTIVYRDLKPENVMLCEDGHIKLTDFGLASEVRCCSSVCGTGSYLAPEVIACKRYGREVDWWGLGVLFFEMIFGRTPFAARDFETLKQRILHRDVVVPEIDGDEWALGDLIQRLLEKDPTSRAGFDDIMKNPFFEDFSVEDLLAKKIKPEYVPGRMADAGPGFAKGDWEGVKNRHRETFHVPEIVVETPDLGGD